MDYFKKQHMKRYKESEEYREAWDELEPVNKMIKDFIANRKGVGGLEGITEDKEFKKLLKKVEDILDKDEVKEKLIKEFYELKHSLGR
ncbi:hypothetical protein ACI2JA_03675 [Alkalihalobacillus sp. NPDC078783]